MVPKAKGWGVGALFFTWGVGAGSLFAARASPEKRALPSSKERSWRSGSPTEPEPTSLGLRRYHWPVAAWSGTKSLARAAALLFSQLLSAASGRRTLSVLRARAESVVQLLVPPRPGGQHRSGNRRSTSA